MEWPLVGRQPTLESMLDLVESGAGVAILGPAGVGKSRLLHELTAKLAERGMPAVHGAASASTRTIPFAPFVELLSSQPTPDQLAMLANARENLRAHAGRGTVLLTVDDAHQLDPVSLAFLLSISSAEFCTIALTVRSGASMPEELVGLWVNGVMGRVDVGPLNRMESRHLAEATLGSMSNELEEELWRLGQGNPLIVHELIEGAVANSIAKEDRGVWSLHGPIAGSARLTDLVSSRLTHIPEDLKPAMDMVAVGNPLPEAVARAAIDRALSQLEGLHLVVWSDTATRPQLIPAHPLYGEILKATMGVSRRKHANGRLAMAACEVPDEVDPLQAALWQYESGAVVSVDMAVVGGREALIRHDPTLAEMLIEPVADNDERAVVILGRSLSYRQQFDQAETVLSSTIPADPLIRADWASIRAQNLGFGLGRVSEARAILEVSASHIDDPDTRSRLLAERALISATIGDFGDAITYSDTVLENHRTSLQTRSQAYVTLTVALSMTGDIDRIDELIDDALATAESARQSSPLAHDQVGVMYAMALATAGQIDESLALALEHARNHEAVRPMTPVWASVASMALMSAGLLTRAEDMVARALETYRVADPFGLEPQGRGVLALIRGQMGRPDAGESLEGIELLSGSPRLKVWIDRGRVWAAVANGDLEAAADMAADGGFDAIAGEHFVWGAMTLHDAARLDRPELVVDSLRQIDTSKGAHLISVMKDHAERLLASDPRGLNDVADRFATMGASLFAAEAYAQASELYREGNDETNGVRSSALSLAWESLCEAAHTPALARRPPSLSPRELQVAIDAAAGLTSPEIGDKRFISTRTVDNHLRAVYRKLELDGREALFQLLGPVAKQPGE